MVTTQRKRLRNVSFNAEHCRRFDLSSKPIGRLIRRTYSVQSQLRRAENLCDPGDPNICGVCRKLAELEEKMTETRKILLGLANQHFMLKQQVNSTHDRLTHRLPVELSANIFKLCLPVPDTAEDVLDFNLLSSSRYILSVPLALSAVCKQWRAIAFGTPQLWKVLLLRIEAMYPKYRPRLVSEWIGRAGTLPLSINIFVGTDGDPFVERAAMQVINVLGQCSIRWRNLKCFCPKHMLERLLSYELPQLQALRMIPNGGLSSGKAFGLNPQRLRTLSVLEIDLRKMVFNWQYLDKLELECSTLSMCFEVLHRAPSLTQCTFRANWDLDMEDLTSERDPLVHAKLEYLQIDHQEEYGDLYAGIIPYLSCPSLKTLVLRSNLSAAVEIPLVVEFLAISNCALLNLSLIHVDISALDIASLCEGIPTLQTLHISLFKLTTASEKPLIGNLFDHLSEFSTFNGIPQPRFLPALRSLTLNEEVYGVQSSWRLWKRLPDILGPAIDASPSPAPYSRALESIAVCMLSSDPWDDLFFDSIGQETIKRILSLQKGGVKWNLEFRPTADKSDKCRRNVLRTACDYFGISSI